MISQTAEYALRAAVHLAANPDSGPAAAKDIADAVQVPVGYLQKVLRMLCRHDLLIASRGATGGFVLVTVGLVALLVSLAAAPFRPSLAGVALHSFAPSLSACDSGLVSRGMERKSSPGSSPVVGVCSCFARPQLWVLYLCRCLHPALAFRGAGLGTHESPVIVLV